MRNIRIFDEAFRRRGDVLAVAIMTAPVLFWMAVDEHYDQSIGTGNMVWLLSKTAIVLFFAACIAFGLSIVRKHRETAHNAARASAAEREKREAAEVWQRAVDAMDDWVSVHRSDHFIIKANKAATKGMGGDPRAVCGTFCFRTVHGLEHPMDGCPLVDAVRSRTRVTREVRDPASGRWFLETVWPVENDGAEPAEVVHVMRDITEEKRQVPGSV